MSQQTKEGGQSERSGQGKREGTVLESSEGV